MLNDIHGYEKLLLLFQDVFEISGSKNAAHQHDQRADDRHGGQNAGVPQNQNSKYNSPGGIGNI